MKTDDVNRIINDLQENIKAGADINAGAGGYDIGTTESQAAFHAGRNRSWKEEVIDQLVCCHIYNGTHEHNPRKAVNDLISWHVQVALDPQVSSDAQALIDRGAAAEREACIEAVEKSRVIEFVVYPKDYLISRNDVPRCYDFQHARSMEAIRARRNT